MGGSRPAWGRAAGRSWRWAACGPPRERTTRRPRCWVTQRRCCRPPSSRTPTTPRTGRRCRTAGASGRRGRADGSGKDLGALLLHLVRRAGGIGDRHVDGLDILLALVVVLGAVV